MSRDLVFTTARDVKVPRRIEFPNRGALAFRCLLKRHWEQTFFLRLLNAISAAGISLPESLHTARGEVVQEADAVDCNVNCEDVGGGKLARIDWWEGSWSGRTTGATGGNMK